MGILNQSKDPNNYISLIKTPPALALLSANDIDAYIKYQFIPWQKQDHKLVIITSMQTNELAEFVRNKYQQDVVIIIDNDLELHKFISIYFRKYLITKAIYFLPKFFKNKSCFNLFNINFLFKTITLLFLSLICCLFYPDFSLDLFLLSSNIVFLTSNLFKLILFLKTKSLNTKHVNYSPPDLPTYSILIALYQESTQVKNIINAICRLEYDQDKLDVKLVIEEDDVETYLAIQALDLPKFFEVIKVPYSMPRTKPKALNYALNFATGKYVTVYDSEDIPDSDQLLKALCHFRQASKDVICIQAKLNFYNQDENLLTSLFSLEYNMWFNYLLPALAKFNMPVPLGGSSNHFIRDKLIEIGAWDSFNVTEDADLGLRLASMGYRCEILNSYTQEESVINVISWIKQRTRWIKGFMQTTLVGTGYISDIYKYLGVKGVTGAICFIFTPAIIYLITPIYFYSYYQNIYSDKAIISLLGVINLIFLIPLNLYYAYNITKKSHYKYRLTTVIIFPFYFILHIIASYRAIFQLFTRMYFWEKTKHGESKLAKVS